MWYEAYNPIAPRRCNQTLLCYAVSHDGIDWQRPSVGIYDYEGSKDNNIVYRGQECFDTPTVVIDPFDPPEAERFKMVLYDTKEQRFLRFFSSDGVRWTKMGVVDLGTPVGDRHSLMIDQERGCWVIYYKTRGRECPPHRTIFMATSEDLEHWEEMGEVLAPQREDQPETEFYGMVGFRDQGWGIGFLEMFSILERRLDAQLVTLDEANRPSRLFLGQPFLQCGDIGDWDSAWLFPSNNPPIRFGEQLRIYYQGRRTLHWATPGHGGRGHIGAIGLANLRVHGYCFLEASGGLGTLTTVPLTMGGHFVCINGDASGGSIRVELLDASGAPLHGYTKDDCYPLTSDATYFKLTWTGVSRLDQIKGKTVRLRFYLDRSRLYSFWFSSGSF